jgi:vancomycin resistance protein VanJ
MLKLKKSLIFTVSLAYLFFIFILALAPFWPTSIWWVANCFEVLPVWVLFLPALFLLFISVLDKEVKSIWFNAISIVMILLWIMGFNIPSVFQSFRVKQNTFHIRVLTTNVGGVTDFEPLYNFILKTDPDIIAFQETDGKSQDFITRDLGAKGWNSQFKEQLGIATKYKILDSDYKNRQMFGGWGAVVAYFTLETPKGNFTFFNVHLETPRKGIEPLMDEKLAGIPEMKRITDQQENESILASKWSEAFEPVLVAGDFNMLTSNPIFKKYWDQYRDTFSEKGSGFGYTKFTHWHAVRIDHVLVDRYWYIQNVLVGDDIKGDHRPYMADVELISDYLLDIGSPKKEVSPVDLSKILLLEDFENSKGGFMVGPGTSVQLEKGGKDHPGRVLHVIAGIGAQQYFINLVTSTWPLETCPTVKFSYKIPVGTPVGLMGQSEWGDWICLAGTKNFTCPTTPSPNAVLLDDDLQWHSASVNAKNLIQALLPGVKNLKNIQLIIPSNRLQSDQFWVDDFGIYKKE